MSQIKEFRPTVLSGMHILSSRLASTRNMIHVRKVQHLLVVLLSASELQAHFPDKSNKLTLGIMNEISKQRNYARKGYFTESTAYWLLVQATILEVICLAIFPSLCINLISSYLVQLVSVGSPSCNVMLCVHTGTCCGCKSA